MKSTNYALLMVGCSSLLITVACNFFEHKNTNRPADNFTSEDMEITSCRNILQENLEDLEHINKKMVSFQALHEIAVVPDSSLLYLLSDEHEILKIDGKGNLQFKIKKYGQGPGEMILPISLKYRNQKLYVLDHANQKISLFSSTGEWLRDIVIHDNVAETFDVDINGNILLPRVISVEGSENPLFFLYSQDGKFIRSFSSNKYLSDDFIAKPPRPILYISPDNYIVLGFRIHGSFYKFSPEGDLLSKSDICNGEEWKTSVKDEIAFNKRMNTTSYQLRLNDIFFMSNGNILVSWGGNFKNRKSMAIIYNAKGNFIGRLFKSTHFPYPCTVYNQMNDSTFCIFSEEKYLLVECRINKLR
jgi:hypothetical protein